MSHQNLYLRITENIEKVIRGQSHAIKLVLATLFGNGHVLLEDVPGTGKTTLAKALARSISADYKRIQFTPDLLPTDILGVSIFNPANQSFNFHFGPVFTNILLADEINRASPRTQSALLEAMAENQVSLDGENRKLPDLFFVIATQNPIEFHGTYPLPEAQMDRFTMRINLGFVSENDEVGILNEQNENHPLMNLSAVVTMDEMIAGRHAVSQVKISDELKHYIVQIVRETRSSEGVLNGASPRASLALMKSAQAIAMFENRQFVTPDDIQLLTVPVIAHRLILDSKSKFSGRTAEQIVTNIIESLPVPT